MSHAPHNISRVTSKGQATIPSAVRKRLGLKPGDRVVYEIEGDSVVIRKAAPEENAFYRLQDTAFSEWSSPADEAAYGGL
ncbi:AbrB/MazE/SpoVT family DNA-binding domain-containing protein [Rhodovibrio sodomensis]|nr:AbrB/MazE/SpoVT family DNA-binding domain-containing protein [Rhodovibrio sodomensis]